MLGIYQFQYALKEAQITEAEELILTREDFYQELKALWKENSLQIVPLAELSRNRWELLRASFTYCSKPLFPCYRTISRHWNNQPFISALLPNQEFYNMLEDGSRILLSQLEDTQYGISVSNRFKWILYLTNKRLHDTIQYISNDGIQFNQMHQLLFMLIFSFGTMEGRFMDNEKVYLLQVNLPMLKYGSESYYVNLVKLNYDF